MPINVKNLLLAVLQARHQGNTPVEIHANARSVGQLRHSIDAPRAHKRTLLQKLLGKKYALDNTMRFAGVPVIENELCQDDWVALRSIQAADDPNWMDDLRDGNGNPFNTVESDGAAEVTLDALSASTGRPTPSDLLMKSFKGIESVSNVIVIRIQRNGDVDLSTTGDQSTTLGALQFAMSHVMNGGR